MARVQKGKWCGNWYVIHTMGHGMFWCRCSCGYERAVIAGNLAAKGKSRNCTGHRLGGAAPGSVRNHPLYPTWNSMLARCYNPGRKDYDVYGGDGATVCDRWLSFDNFVADVGERPPGKELDRWPDQNGEYSPKNFRWATKSENARNRRSTRFITAKGQTRSVAEWAELTGMSVQTIVQRIDRYGWSEQDAIATPKAPRKPRR